MFFLLPIVAGVFAALSFAPIAWAYGLLISMPLLYFVWRKATPKAAFFSGLLFGLAFFTMGVSWVFISIHEHGQTSAPLAAILTLLFIVFMALFPALQGYLLARVYPENTPYKWLFIFPATWVLSEWLRSVLLTGFPWLLLGYSQINTPLRGYLPILGTYGVSFLVIFSSLLLVYSFKRGQILRQRLAYLSLFLGLYGGGHYLSDYSWTQAYQPPKTISLIQGNIAQPLKWSPEQVYNTIDIYQRLTEQHWQSDIIIWPEAAIPLPYEEASGLIAATLRRAQRENTTLLMGAAVSAENGYFYNALMLEGRDQGRYFKKHLVPFGEYLPLEAWLRGTINFFSIPMSNFIAGAPQQPAIFAHELRIAPFICYEIAYAHTILQHSHEADLLVTINDMAWFGDSLAARQHLQMAQVAALQTGRFHAYASNNGITAVIDSTGKIVDYLPQFVEGVLTASITAMQGNTPWMLLGHWLIIYLMMLFCALPWMLKGGPDLKSDMMRL